MDADVVEKLALFGQQALGEPGDVINSYNMAAHSIELDIPGDFVECGVFCGTQVAAMALANQVFKAGRKIHLFDSFQGIPQAGPNDGDDIKGCIGDGKGELVSSGVAVQDVDAVKGHMAGWQIDPCSLVYHPGWFQDTLPTDVSQLFDCGIAVLRLDGVLYESIATCLRYLSPLVHEDGYVIIDAYRLKGCKQAVFDYFLAMRQQPELLVIKDGGGGVFYRKDWF
ncbi:MAG TPA: TylF/MycF/NovP-related O-methyltransferase [Sedimentisphaerales bacterium]|nr:TylF/MycF/NovP-related O-methyltransferase [Sedimentisphaerales bacterium]